MHVLHTARCNSGCTTIAFSVIYPSQRRVQIFAVIFLLRKVLTYLALQYYQSTLFMISSTVFQIELQSKI